MNSAIASTSNHAASDVTDAAKNTLTSDIRIVTPGLSAEEIAAVTAVVSAALADQESSGTPSSIAKQSEWMATRRPLRTSVHPGPGHWGRRPA